MTEAERIEVEARRLFFVYRRTLNGDADVPESYEALPPATRERFLVLGAYVRERTREERRLAAERLARALDRGEGRRARLVAAVEADPDPPPPTERAAA